jgi:hypothetical protein
MPICPTCQASFDQAVSQPAQQQTPSIPPANDLQSLIYAVQMLTQGYNQLTGRNGNNQNQTKNNTPRPPNKPKLGRFVEFKQGRVTSTVKVYSKQDPSTFVEVKQINAMTFQDSVTGEIWTWGR